jgi:hypothetical protein
MSEQGSEARDAAPASRVDKPLTELLSDITANVATLIRKELELARIEVKQDAVQAARAGAMLGAAGAMGLVFLILVWVTVALLLNLALPLWASFLISTVLAGAVTAFLAIQGRGRMKQVNPVPEQTVETFKEDVEWLRTRSK